ncbi:MAG: hypothetical protein R2706_14580 [Acidimicrobiales bacterium]
MFDTRSGLWLMVALVATAVVATVAVIAFAPQDALTFDTFGAAIGIPMSVLLPVLAIMSVSSEFSQRTALATFTLIPSRHRLTLVKFGVVLAVGVASILVAVSVAAGGNVLGAMIRGIDPVWNLSLQSIGQIVLGQVLGMAFGFMCGVLFRNSPAAIVSYFVGYFVLAGLGDVLAALQPWFEDVRGWVDFNYVQAQLFGDTMTSEFWLQLAVTSAVWIVLPLAVGVRRLLSAEVH